MPVLIPPDPPSRAQLETSALQSSRPPPPPPRPEPATASIPRSISRLPPTLRFNSPTYGLAPETVALLRPTGDLGRASSAEAADPSASRFPSPPPIPFDGPTDDSTAAWTRWLDERRQLRRVTRTSPPTVSSSRSSTVEDATASLNRLRASAESLRRVESRLGDVRRSTSSTAPFLPPLPPGERDHTRGSAFDASLAQFSDSLEEPRRALEQVRQRLDETRRRVIAVTETRRAREVELDEAAERARAQARDSLDRTVELASRLDQLAQTLNHISQRATALSPALDPQTTTASTSSPVISSSSALETPSLAAQTDSIRATVRQLILASRRVSAAVDRHRESVAAAAASPSPSSSFFAPLPAPDEPLRVVLPSSPPAPSSWLTSPAAPPAGTPVAPGTSPNPSGLLLPPSSLFTASPLPLSPAPEPAPTADPARENYPGERAQLLRIAALQADIATRAGELRGLRGRGREVEAEWRAGAGEEKEEEEGGASRIGEERVPLLLAGRAGREVVGCLGADGARKRPRTAEERRRDYALYAFCGR